ncbi:50S ribosomal protein L19e [Candidatus Micrarchaeota archaeon]|nr:50S ribosomal protein L19e [Candidatus Micrarchaeota archaeon]
MTLATVRRLAADLLCVGENKIKISPDGMKEAEGALTRSDVRSLIEKGIVKKLPNQGRASARKRDKRSAGRTRGARVGSKTLWMEKVRAQRKLLFELLDSGVLKKTEKWSIYRKVKSGLFRNKKAMVLYLKDNGLVPKDFEPSPRAAPKGVASKKSVSSSSAPAQKKSSVPTGSSTSKVVKKEKGEKK